jgi:DNA-binding transcriptional ArsR family regulator
MEVEGDVSEIKVLTSYTRIEILKKLSERNYTVSELSRILELSKPTILHHIRILENAGFVQRVDDERKWVYYTLTERGKIILRLRRIKLVLSFLLITLPVALILSLLRTLKVAEKTPKAVMKIQTETSVTPKALGGGFELSLELILFLLLILVILVYFLVNRKIKKFETQKM